MSNIIRLQTDQAPIRTIPLIFCTAYLYDGWAWTAFPDGSGFGAFPHDEPDYRELSRRLGYDSTMDYCWQHEVCHNLVEQEVFGRPSPILWALAHGLRHPDTTPYEEALVQAFQGFLRGATPTMTAVAPGVDWWEIKQKALGLLGADPSSTASEG
jgi:hypothetical protein